MISQELLPFLADCMDDEDDVLIAVAKSLGNFVDYVGGSQEAEILLPLLQTLLMVGKCHTYLHSIHLYHYLLQNSHARLTFLQKSILFAR
jgi:hypothetical protein